MRRRRVVGGILATAAVAVGLTVPVSGAGAAPITCKGNQTVQKAPGGGWECVNNGGGTPGGVVETKNPND
jgi:hypothetical protein